MSFRFITLVPTAAIFAIAALWSGSAFAAPAAEVPACPLLTVDEVAGAFGKSVVAAEQEPMGGGGKKGRMTVCFWSPADGGIGPTLSLILWSWPSGGSGAGGYMEAFQQIAEEYPDMPTPEPVAIGDDALWDGTTVHVRKGDMTFSLSSSMNALDVPPDARAKLEALAGMVAERL